MSIPHASRTWVHTWPLLLALVLTALSPRPLAAAPEPPALQAPLHRDHPLVGEIRRVADGAAMSPQQTAELLAGHTYVLLGERHDNADHHALQAWAVRALARAGRAPAVAFEMIDRSQAQSLADHLEAHPGDAAGLGEAVEWEARGWPDWAIYRPIAEAALAHGLPLVAADAGRETSMRVGREGYAALGDGAPARLALDVPLPAPQRAQLQDELQAGHCNMLPEKALAPMAKVQRLRDAVLADSLIDAAGTADGAVLIAGGGHVRADRAVPWYLRQRLGDPSVAVVNFMEVQPGENDWRAYLPESPTGPPAYDVVWFTPAAERGDPCAEFADQIKKHGEKRAAEPE